MAGRQGRLGQAAEGYGASLGPRPAALRRAAPRRAPPRWPGLVCDASTAHPYPAPCSRDEGSEIFDVAATY